MKNVFALLSVAGILSGCASSPDPYDHLENWLVREDAVRPFAVPADIIYVQDRLYVDMDELPSMQTYAKDAIGRGKFHGIARIFSPLVVREEDVEKAVKWYLKRHCDGTRPFFFIGEGKGGALLKSYGEKNMKRLSGKGLAAGFYSEKPDIRFVSAGMVDEIRKISLKKRYGRQWGREMPDRMDGR